MGMETMKHDWASRKARAIFDAWWKIKTPTGQLVTELAKALRQERRRAVLKCHRLLLDEHGEQYLKGYNKACDDCATAIAGGK